MVLIPLRATQKKSLESVMIEYVGGEQYYQELGDTKCLIILDGLDEMAALCLQNDSFFQSLVKDCTKFERATVMITSRPLVCRNLVPQKTIEIVGFGQNAIKKFVEASFANDPSTVDEFLSALNENPLLYSLCYVPLSLSMLVDIFRIKALPSTLTKLYQIFIVMALDRELGKSYARLVVAATSAIDEEAVSRVLPSITKEAINIVYSLAKLAFSGFFDIMDDGWDKKNPKLMFTEEDITKSGIKINSNFDGFGLLKAIQILDLPFNITNYSFFHATVQEFLSAVYISTLQFQKQFYLFTKYYKEFSTMFAFYCGMTRFACNDVQKFVQSKIVGNSYDDNHDDDGGVDNDKEDTYDTDDAKDGENNDSDNDGDVDDDNKGNSDDDYDADDDKDKGSDDDYDGDVDDNENNNDDYDHDSDFNEYEDNEDDKNDFDDDILAAVLCQYESQWPVDSPTQFELDVSYNLLLSYECHCLCHVLSCHQVSQLKLKGCHIGDKGVQMLRDVYSQRKDEVLVHLDLCSNSLTVDGIKDVMEIMKSKPFKSIHITN